MNRKELVQTLELLKPALAKNDVVPIFQCFTFNNNGTVSAYDDTIAIVGPCELEHNCGIDGNTLLGLLSNSSAEDVDFKIKDTEAIITCGKTISRLAYAPLENFIFKEPEQKWSFKIPYTVSVHEALKMCLETVSSDTTQTGLLGVTLEGNRMYSCNGDAVTKIGLKHDVEGRILLPTPFCEAVIRLWEALQVTSGTLRFNGGWAYAALGDYIVYGRVLEIPEPIDFEALIKKTIKTKIPTQPLPTDLSDALSRARVLADPESQKTIVTINKGKLVMLTEVQHMGEIKDDLTFKGHPDVVAYVNASHLQKAIGYCDKIAFHSNCTVLEKDPGVLLLVGNME
jgi:DNA polymerase III sliding clamp (beta) subunit (PCNA family)